MMAINGQSVYSLPECCYLQKVQDSFVERFPVSIMLVGTNGVPITKPHRWNLVCDATSGDAVLPPGCRRHIKTMLFACGEFGEVALSRCPYSERTTLAVPIIAKGTLEGVWILDQLQIAEFGYASNYYSMVRWLQRESAPALITYSRETADTFAFLPSEKASPA